MKSFYVILLMLTAVLFSCNKEQVENKDTPQAGEKTDNVVEEVVVPNNDTVIKDEEKFDPSKYDKKERLMISYEKGFQFISSPDFKVRMEEYVNNTLPNFIRDWVQKGKNDNEILQNAQAKFNEHVIIPRDQQNAKELGFDDYLGYHQFAKDMIEDPEIKSLRTKIMTVLQTQWEYFNQLTMQKIEEIRKETE